MKTYRINLLNKVIYLLFCFTCFVGAIFFLISELDMALVEKTIAIIAVCFSAFAVYGINALKIMVDDEKITVKCGPLFKGRTVFWYEIKEANTYYCMFPEQPVIILKPDGITKKKPLRIPLLSLDLTRDIIFQLPRDRIYIYPYLKHKLEGKQTIFYKDT